MSDLRDLIDRRLTDGRFRREPADFRCPDCEHEWAGTIETEYGTSVYVPHDQCPRCGGDPEWREAEPPEPERER